MELLLENYNALFLKNRNGETPFESAAEEGRNTIVNFFLEKEGFIKSNVLKNAFSKAVVKGNIEIVKLLLPQIKQDWIQSALFEAAKEPTKEPAIVKLLLKHGAKKNTKNKNNETPLEIAERRLKTCNRTYWTEQLNLTNIIEILKETSTDFVGEKSVEECQ